VSRNSLIDAVLLFYSRDMSALQSSAAAARDFGAKNLDKPLHGHRP
jgi:hypothetical protein